MGFHSVSHFSLISIFGGLPECGSPSLALTTAEWGQTRTLKLAILEAAQAFLEDRSDSGSPPAGLAQASQHHIPGLCSPLLSPTTNPNNCAHTLLPFPSIAHSLPGDPELRLCPLLEGPSAPTPTNSYASLNTQYERTRLPDSQGTSPDSPSYCAAHRGPGRLCNLDPRSTICHDREAVRDCSAPLDWKALDCRAGCRRPWPPQLFARSWPRGEAQRALSE